MSFALMSPQSRSMRSQRYSRFVFGLPLILLIEASMSQAQVEAPAVTDNVRTLTFEGVLCQRRIPLKELDASMRTDWSDYSHLVLEMRCSSPQRFALWIY